MAKKETLKLFKNVLKHTILILIGFFMIYPILWIIASSLKPENEIFQNSLSLMPSEIKWDNYAIGWKGFGNYNFGIFFKNSFIVTFCVMIGTFISSTLSAFGFARTEFRLKKILFACLLATMMLPSQIMLIPQYILFKRLNWVDTHMPLIVPAFMGGNAFFIFLLIQFIRGLPVELDESAIIDGCSIFGVFMRIILPLMKGAITTVLVFSFLWTWEDFMQPLIYLSSVNRCTIPRGLQMFADPQAVTAWGPLLAMSALSILPVFIIFVLFQKYIVEGIATTGIKG